MSRFDEAFASDKRVEEALRHAAHDAWTRHKQGGHSVAGWHDGKVVWHQPAEFPEPGLELTEHDQRIARLAQELNELPEDKLFLAAAYIRQLRES